MNQFTVCRVKAGMRQKEAAIKVGVAQSAISAWENGICLPTGEHLSKLAEIYDCQVKELMPVLNTKSDHK